MRLVDMKTHGQYFRLGEDPPHEVAFGMVGRFWGGETRWEEIDASEFSSFNRPGYDHPAVVQVRTEHIDLRRRGRGPRRRGTRRAGVAA